METTKTKKGLILYSTSGKVAQAFAEVDAGSSRIQWETHQEDLPTKESLKIHLENFDVAILLDDFSFLGPSVVQRRSVGSHFLQYIDLVVREDGQFWGYSLFSEAYREVLLQSIQNQDFKGPVIFLGTSPIALPIIQVLANFGFNDFVFLMLNREKRRSTEILKNMKGLLGITVSSVDSAAFIQSQKEGSKVQILSPQKSINIEHCALNI